MTTTIRVLGLEAAVNDHDRAARTVEALLAEAERCAGECDPDGLAEHVEGIARAEHLAEAAGRRAEQERALLGEHLLLLERASERPRWYDPLTLWASARRRGSRFDQCRSEIWSGLRRADAIADSAGERGNLTRARVQKLQARLQELVTGREDAAFRNLVGGLELALQEYDRVVAGMGAMLGTAERLTRANKLEELDVQVPEILAGVQAARMAGMWVLSTHELIRSHVPNLVRARGVVAGEQRVAELTAALAPYEKRREEIAGHERAIPERVSTLCQKIQRLVKANADAACPGPGPERVPPRSRVDMLKSVIQHPAGRFALAVLFTVATGLPTDPTSVALAIASHMV